MHEGFHPPHGFLSIRHHCSLEICDLIIPVRIADDLAGPAIESELRLGTPDARNREHACPAIKGTAEESRRKRVGFGANSNRLKRIKLSRPVAGWEVAAERLKGPGRRSSSIPGLCLSVAKPPRDLKPLGSIP